MKMEEKERESLISSKTPKYQIIGHDDDGDDDDELISLKACLNWVYVDQSNPWKTSRSWSVFFLLTVGVPILSHFFLACDNCDEDHKQPFGAIVELSLSLISALSFFSLTNFERKYGLRKLLFLDKLCGDSDKVRNGYKIQLQKSIKILCIFVLPCFAANIAYKIWWYITGGNKIPHLGNIIVSHSIAFILEQFSWLYRTSIFFLACVLYHASCSLLILRLDEFVKVFQVETNDVASVLIEHLRIRKTLRVISHRFRAFILSTLLIVTASQLASLLVTTKYDSPVDIYTAGELALCSVTLVTGLCICLRSATKITHKAQSITSLAGKWHVCATIDSFDGTDGEIPTLRSASHRDFSSFNEYSTEDEDDDEDELDNAEILPTFVNTISYQKRQALVTYLKNNRAGITMFGFMLDRTYLHTIFGVELSLVLCLLKITVGIS